MKEEKFLELIEEKKDSLYRIAYSYSKNKEDALDIVQETIFKAYISKEKLKEARYFHTWLTSILIHTAIDYINKNKKYVPLFEHQELPEQESIQESKDNQEDMMDLESALEMLSAQEKPVIILKLLEDMTFAQVAKTLNQPESTVKSIYIRAMKKLKIEMEGS